MTARDVPNCQPAPTSGFVPRDMPRADHEKTRWTPVVAWGDAEDGVDFLGRHSYLNALEVVRVDPGSTLVRESLGVLVYPHHRLHGRDIKDDDGNQHDPT